MINLIGNLGLDAAKIYNFISLWVAKFKGDMCVLMPTLFKLLAFGPCITADRDNFYFCTTLADHIAGWCISVSMRKC